MKNARDCGHCSGCRLIRSIGAVVAPVFQFSGFTGCDGFFYGGEAAEVDMLLVVPNVGSPLGDALVPDHTRVPGLVVTAFTRVLLILLARNISQIGNSIISSNSVNVVYLVSWPDPMHVKPGKSVF